MGCDNKRNQGDNYFLDAIQTRIGEKGVVKLHV
jgi:hypothetical protein